MFYRKGTAFSQMAL